MLTRYNGLLIKGLFGYKAATHAVLTATLEEMKQDPQVIKAAPKIVSVSDGETILAYDMREKDSYENPLDRLYCDFAFFYPLCGVERFTNIDESPADVKAAEKLAKLHDELRAYNEFSSKSELHDFREAHRVLDDLVDSCYPGYPFANDEARLQCLFQLYKKMTAK